MSEYKRLTDKKVKGTIERHIRVDKDYILSAYDIIYEEKHDIVEMLINRLAELEDKIENGTLIDINDIWYEDEEIKSKKRYIICKYYLIKMLVDVADSKAEAETKLKELQEKE